MNKFEYKAGSVLKAATGNWLRVLSIICPNPAVQLAIKKVGRHVPCPINGGKDGFRLHRTFNESGLAYSNKDGGFKNGFYLIMWLNDWDFPTTLKAVAESLGLKPDYQKFNKTFDEIEYFDKPFEWHGSFIESGEAPYKFRSGATKSFYVKILHKGYELLFWGFDLSDIVHNVLPGDNIILKKIGKQPITINSRNKTINSYRNIWEIVNKTSKDRQEPVQQPQEVEQNIKSEITEVPINNVPDYVLQAEEQSKGYVIDEEEAKRLTDKISKVWIESVAFGGFDTSPVISYLNKRGVSSQLLYNGPDTLRIHPSLALWQHSDDSNKMEKVGSFPTLVAAVRNKVGEIVNMHRTYLTRQGEKVQGMAKKLMSSAHDIAGAAIRIGGIPNDGFLGVAEGIETALSVTKATGMTCWSCISTWGIETFEVPQGVKAVVIWADKDKAYWNESEKRWVEPGLEAAQKLYERLVSEGIPCTIALPKLPLGDNKSVDWNDVLVSQEGGPMAFPNLQQVRFNMLELAEKQKANC